MKITLIRTPVTLTKLATGTSAVPPIGLAYLAANLIKQNHEVLAIDAIGEAINSFYPFETNTLYRGLSIPEIVSRCTPSDVFGLGVMFSQDWPITKLLIKELKNKFPDSKLVIGGEHATAQPIGALEDCPELDFVVTGEGDFVFPDLLTALSNGSDLKSVGSICYRTTEGNIALNPKNSRSKTLDQIPWPAWDLFPIENYLSEGHGQGVNRGRNMPIIASRGCPYQCTFCSNPNMWGTLWTVRTVDDVIHEIDYYIQKYQATNFDFQDLTAIIKKEWIKDFCLKLIAKNINITWQLPTGTRSEAIDEEVAGLLYKSGCRNITYAPESGSADVLKRIKKRITVDKIYKSAHGCVKAGLDVKFNFIFGFPEDTYIDLLHSIGFLAKLGVMGVSDISVSPFCPYPGSELFIQLQNKGKIPKKLNDEFYKKLPLSDMLNNVSWCEQIPPKTLDQLRNLALIVFYAASWISHPTRPFKRISNFLTGKEESRLDKALGDIRRRNIFVKSNTTAPLNLVK